MKSSVVSAWDMLWRSHREAKRLLCSPCLSGRERCRFKDKFGTNHEGREAAEL
ncbi:hypothetical protein PO124_27570 [Bacillus licheniformis]|nr:hypothetical protein [Bacillus licheniformis]